MTGSQALVESLKREGVEVVFGLPGGANMPLYDALITDGAIRHHLVRHEQVAAMMAEGYARSTGKVGVCMATSGPGATNLVTGIADAYMDSVPLIAITGQVGTRALGTDAFQESDILGITLPIVKHSYLVRAAEEIPVTIKEAFHICNTGRPGPVVIDLPKDTQIDELEFEYPETIGLRGYRPTQRGNNRQVKAAAGLIAKSERPLLYAGGGCLSAEASPELRELAERLNAPVVTSLLGKGAFPDDHPLALGMPGMHGRAFASWAMSECDLLIGVGTRFDDRVVGRVAEFATLAAIIHIDVDPAEIGKVVETAIPIVGDCKLVLQQLLGRVEPKAHEAWLQRVQALREKGPLTYPDDDVLRPQYILEQLNELTKGEAIITTDVGQHQMWAAQWINTRHPRTFLTSGGLGAMGFGFPAAMGAQVAHPDKHVFCISGDGSIQMNIQDLITAVSDKLPVTVCILNNRYLGMVKQWQKMFFDRRYSEVDLVDNPDFAKVAEAYGAIGVRVTEKSEVRPTLEATMAERVKPTFIDFFIDRESDVFPMIPSGQSVKEMILNDAI